MSAFDKENLRLIADGDDYAARRFVFEATPTVVELVRWHLEDRGIADQTELLNSIPVEAAIRFIGRLKRNGVMDQPLADWLRILLRVIYAEIWEMPLGESPTGVGR